MLMMPVVKVIGILVMQKLENQLMLLILLKVIIVQEKLLGFLMLVEVVVNQLNLVKL